MQLQEKFYDTSLGRVEQTVLAWLHQQACKSVAPVNAESVMALGAKVWDLMGVPLADIRIADVAPDAAMAAVAAMFLPAR